MAVHGVDEEILQGRSDMRSYRRIVLPNSLQALVITDPETDKAAAAMDVAVGSFNEPDGLEGLAHFLEHMLFYASAKYPIEDSYSKYIAEHGGSTNAYTASDSTNFFFNINVDCFEEALDRFAQFFIHPLMSADATLREIKAVDSENQKNLLNDLWRTSQLQKHLSAKDYPYHRFNTGNLDTLEVSPKAKGLDIRLELIKFYEEHYSANLMHLVVYGKDSLDKLESLVQSMFKDIPNTSRTKRRFVGRPCSPEHLQILVKAIPVKEGDVLRIIWPIPPAIHSYEEGAVNYASHLIGHEGKGSLFCTLKRFGWATSLSCGEWDWTVDFSFFSVVIELTDAGHEHVEDIVGLLFKYIRLTREAGVHEWIFDELVAIREIGFHFQDKIPAIDYAAQIASNMRLYPPRDWLVGSSLPSKFSRCAIEDILSKLSPENVRIFWDSKKFEGFTYFTEPWYKTAYSVEKLSNSTIQQWIENAPDGNLHLPKPNKFIPNDLALKEAKDAVKFPRLLRKSAFSKLWYKPDTMFHIPKAYAIVDFNCPLSCVSPEADILTEIFCRLLTDYLNEFAYDAEVAGLHRFIRHIASGFQVFVIGYNHKMRILLETIIAKIRNFEVKPDRFFVIKETVIKEYENFKFQQPYEQAMYYTSLLLATQTWPWSEQLEILPLLEAEHLVNFVPQLLSRTFLECYMAGNLEPNEAESIVEHLEDVLFTSQEPICKPLFSSQHLSLRVVKLEKDVKYYYPVMGLNQKDENSALLYYIQVSPDDIKINVRLQLFVLIAKQHAFHQLRSVEQLGYITLLRQRDDFGVRGLQFIIQSSVKGAADLDTRVESFLELFEAKLHDIAEEEFKSNVNALIDMKLEKHKNLREESTFFWREIVDGTLRFDRKDAEIAALREITYQDLLDFFNTYIKLGSPNRKYLSVQVFGGGHVVDFDKVVGYEPKDGRSNRIENAFGFRRSRQLYGSFRGGSGQVKL